MKTLKKYFRSGFTLIELLVVISIIAILAALALPAITGAISRAQLGQQSSNARQLHIAQTQMAMEAITTGDTNFGWVGDLGITSVQDFVSRLVTNNFMHPADAVKVFSCPGITQGTANDTDATITADNTGFSIYKAQDKDPGVTIFVTTKNYTWNTELDKNTKPFGDSGFMVLRKSGDAAVYRKSQATQTNLLGALPAVETTPLD